VFNLSGSEIIVILLLALVILGPEKLPEAMRKAGRAYSELRKMANSFQSEVRSVIDEPMEELRGTADMLRDATDFSGGTKKAGPTKPAAANPRPSPGAARSAPAVSSPSTDPDDGSDDRPADGPDDVLGAALDDEDGTEAAPEDLVTRTLSGDVAPHDPVDEAGSNQ
jgi:sec-independent protein translocase protein TatB